MTRDPKGAAGRRGRYRRLVSMIVVDVTPLRSAPRFKWLFMGQACGVASRQLLIVAVPYQIFVLTGSTLMVGLIGMVQIAPLLVFSLLGGAAADSSERRRILGGAYAVLTATSVAFGLNSSTGNAVWPIFVLIAINAAAMGVESPTRTAVIPAVVGRETLASAFALNQTLNQAARIVFPALAGILIARAGIVTLYWVSAASNVLAAAALLPLGSQPPATAGGGISGRAIRDGWRHLRRIPLLQQIMLIDLNAMVFGMPRALFPVIGIEILAGGATAVGLLHAAPGMGALAGALTTGWVAHVRRQGRVVIYSVVVWGLAIAAFGLAWNLPLALALLAVAGASDVISNVFRNAVFQLAVAESFRGRLTAFKAALSGGGPHLGDFESGAVAALTTPRISAVSGGLLSVLGALAICLWVGRGELWRQRADDEPPGEPPLGEPLGPSPVPPSA